MNTCFKAKGRTSSIEGSATPVPGSGNARLRVKFGGLAALVPVARDGNYWIIALGESEPDAPYEWALVGTPDRRFPGSSPGSPASRRKCSPISKPKPAASASM